jgi:peptide/nickel transport system substrate-binding protein
MKKRAIWSLLSLLIVASMLLVACGGQAEPTQAPAEPTAAPAEPTAAPAEPTAAPAEPTAAPAEPTQAPEPTSAPAEMGMYNEAPMLADMVAAGDLPPVDERLPAEPVVVEVTDTVGQYGGTWHTVTGDAGGLGNIKMKLYEPLWRWNPDYTGYEPGLAASYEMNDACTEITWHLREGIRWSDGEPYTTEDLKFWWEDLALNQDFAVVSVPWYGYQTDGTTPMDVTFPDDYTMVWSNFKPNCIAPYIIAQGFWEMEPLHSPKHYLSQFHPTYNSDVTSYEDLELNRKWWENPDHPVLFAWHVESQTPGERTVFVRNPYYWKVDPEGNQLPYIDRMDVSIIADPEVRLLELSTGKYEASFRGVDNPTDIPFLLEQAGSGGYHLQDGWMNGAGGWPMWIINQDYAPDEEIRDLLRSTPFRKGLSVALDRDRLIDVAWDGIATPQQATISPQSWHFASPEGQQIFHEWQQSDAQYDPELAKQYFDEAGFVDADGDGWRDLPSGKPFELVIDITDWGGLVVPLAGTEVFAGNLEDVGVKVLQNNLGAGNPEADVRDKESSFMLRVGHESEVDIWTYPDWLFPLRGGGEGSRSWPMEGKYRSTGGKEGWEPEGVAKQLQDLYDQGVVEPDEQKRHEIVWEAIRIHMEQGPFNLGAAGDQPMPVVVSDKMHNVSTYGVLGPWAPGSPGNQHPEQYWFEQ